MVEKGAASFFHLVAQFGKRPGVFNRNPFLWLKYVVVIVSFFKSSFQDVVAIGFWVIFAAEID